MLVSHHVEEIPPGFTHALVLADGHVVAAGPLDEVVTRRQSQPRVRAADRRSSGSDGRVWARMRRDATSGSAERATRECHIERRRCAVSTPSSDVPGCPATIHAPARRDDWPAAIAGVVATATALGVSELLAGLLPGATSLVAAVGQVVIDNQPPGAKDVVVALFGTNDKLAFELVIVAVALADRGRPGLLARRRYEIAAGAFVALRRASASWPRSAIRSRARRSRRWRRPSRSAAGLLVLGWLLDLRRSATATAARAGSSVDAPASRSPRCRTGRAARS